MDSVHLEQSHANGGLVLVRPVRGNNLVGIRPSGTKSRERRACPSSVWYEESSRWDFIHLIRSCSKGKLVPVHPVQGIKLVGLHQSGTRSHERRACPRLFFLPIESRETLKVILKRKQYREHAMGPREPTSKPIARVQTQYIRKQAQAKPNRPPKTK